MGLDYLLPSPGASHSIKSDTGMENSFSSAIFGISQSLPRLILDGDDALASVALLHVHSKRLGARFAVPVDTNLAVPQRRNEP